MCSGARCICAGTACKSTPLDPRHRYIIYVDGQSPKTLATIVLILEVDLFHAMPALYSDGFMKYTYNVDHYI